MKQRPRFLALFAFALLGSISATAAQPIAGQPPYVLMKTGEVIPQGWLLEQLRGDLAEGLTGAYDRISENVGQNLFATQNRRPGSHVRGNRGQPEKAWWAGEHEGYWMDALVRTAILTRHRASLARARAWVERILTASEKSGYIGIYAPGERFPAAGFDGELWTQSRADQALIAWYEYTGDTRVLAALQRSVRKTIDHYRNSTYFGRPGADGGVAHGVAYLETLEWLFRTTGDRYFADAAVWLYSDYSSVKGFILQDLQRSRMLDATALWQDHAPHVAEALGMPGIVSFFTGDPSDCQASDNVLVKLARHTNPGGGVIAGKLESIAGVEGGGDEANEYCSMTEGIESLSRLFMYRPDFRVGDWSERCALNAAQGARFQPVNKAVVYLSRDNRIEAARPNVNGGRELFSASHMAAACCTLNAMRLMPYYVEGMWYRSTERAELLANLYGPSQLSTEIGGTRVTIEEATTFPFSDHVRFVIRTAQPTRFDLTLRVPANSGPVEVTAVHATRIERSAKTITIGGNWSDGDEVLVNFRFQVVQLNQCDNRQAYYQWGPLVFALPFTSTVELLHDLRTADGADAGFGEYAVRSVNPAGWRARLDPQARFRKVDVVGDPLRPFAHPPIALEGTVLAPDNARMPVLLIPMGSAILRRTTFPVSRDILPSRQPATGSDVDATKDPMRDY